MRTTVMQGVMICVCAFLGGMVSEQLFRPNNSYADGPTNVVQSITQNGVYRDNYGRKRIGIDAAGDFPIQNFYGEDGLLRLQLGTYRGTEREGGDAGKPLVGLSDNKGRLRMLLRVAQGTNMSPLLIMKDSKGKDRIIMGTDLNGKDEEPFMVYFDKYGTKHSVFGNF